MPRRPPYKWYWNAVNAISKNPEIDNPRAVAGWMWYHGLDAEQKKQILTEERQGTTMTGLPAKYAKMGFKKGWRMFHAAHGRHRMHGMEGFDGASKKRGHKKSRVHHAFWLDGDIATPGLIRRPVKKLSSITPGKVMSPLIDIALIIAGMGLGAGLKKVSPIKNPHLMNAGGGVIGIGGSLITRNRFVKLPLIGVALQSAISEVKTVWPNMPLPIAGDDEVVYLPMGEEPEQIVYQGEDDRVGAVVDGEDDRVGAVVDGDENRVEGDDDGMEGDEGRNA